MCLELPVELVEVTGPDHARARSGGREVEVSLLMLDDRVAAGDWVLAHSGYALHRISAEQARAALRIREEER